MHTTWDLDHLALTVPASASGRFAAAASVGLALAAGTIGARLGAPEVLLGLLPAAWIARRLLAPVAVEVGFRGVRVGRAWFPRAQILGASAKGGRARLALTDGRVVTVPLPGPAEREALVAALARPGALFEGMHARDALRVVRPEA